jgi:hypothetical protein
MRLFAEQIFAAAASMMFAASRLFYYQAGIWPLQI